VRGVENRGKISMTVATITFFQTATFALRTYDRSASFAILANNFCSTATDITRKKAVIGAGFAVR
jgi:hypothetical protein